MKEAELDWAVVFMDEEVILFQNDKSSGAAGAAEHEPQVG